LTVCLQLGFANSAGKSCDEKSPKCDKYNCIAFAMGDVDRWWWPTKRPTAGVFWPLHGIGHREPTVSNFMAMLHQQGFSSCQDGNYEQGFDKVELCSQPFDRVTHIAKLLPDGTWHSKLGPDEDVIHELSALEGSKYGKVVGFYRRQSN
jgi:hypothetical protein